MSAFIFICKPTRHVLIMFDGGSLVLSVHQQTMLNRRRILSYLSKFCICRRVVEFCNLAIVPHQRTLYH